MGFEIILSILFLIFNWLDFYITKRALDKGWTEFNPVLKFIGLLPSKIVGSILIVVAGYFSTWALIVPTLAVMGACVWNIIQINKVK